MEFSKINIQKITRNGDVPTNGASSYFSSNSGGGESVDLGPVYSSISGINGSLSAVSATTVALSAISHSHSNKAVLDELTDNQLTWINILKDKIEFDSAHDAIKFNTNIYSVSGVSAFGLMDNKAEVNVDLSNYYLKNETSSKTEISNAISTLQASIPTGLSVDLSNYYTKNQTSGATELSTKFSDYLTKEEVNNSLNSINTSLSADEDTIKKLKDLFKWESEERENTYENLRDEIDDEVTNRTDNDAYLSGVCTGLSSSLSTESTNRINADNNLNNLITAETASRINGDNSLNNAITAETANRKDADAALHNAITTETTLRNNSDGAIINSIDAETKNRKDNDAYLSGVCTGLSSAISSESTNRVNGDNSLHDAITAETSSRVNADNSLSNSISSEARERQAQDGNLSNRIQQLETLLSHLTWDSSINAYRVSGSLYATQGLTALKQ